MADAPGLTSDRSTTRTGRILVRLDRAAHRRWFLPAVAVFPISDFALPVLRNQILSRVSHYQSTCAVSPMRAGRTS
jgi:hypothetical protein